MAIFNQQDKLDLLEFVGQKHQEFILKDHLKTLSYQLSPNQNRSPKLSKTMGKQRNQQQEGETVITYSHIASAPVSDYGFTGGVQSFLEVDRRRCCVSRAFTDRALDRRNSLSHA